MGPRLTVEERRALEEQTAFGISLTLRRWPYAAQYSVPDASVENMSEAAYRGRAFYDAAMRGNLNDFLPPPNGACQ